MWYRCDFGLTELASQRLFAPEQHSGQAFRRLIAKLADQHDLGLPSAVFNYIDGRPNQAPPPVRFIAYARGVALIGIGAEGARLAREVAPAIHAAMIRKAGALISTNERSGRITFAPMPMPVRYFCPSALLSPTAKVGKWLEWVDEAKAAGTSLAKVAPAREAIERLIEASLVRQMDWLDPVSREDTAARSSWGLLECEDDEGTMYTRADKPFTVNVIDGGRHFLQSRLNHTGHELKDKAGVGPKGTLPLVGIRGLEFTVNAHLKGIWQIGRLTSAGNGLVIASNRHAELPEAA